MGLFTHIFAYSLGQSDGRAQAERDAADAERERQFQEALAKEPAREKIAARAVAEALVGDSLSESGKATLRDALDADPEQAASDAAMVADALRRQKEARVPAAKGSLSAVDFLIPVLATISALWVAASSDEIVSMLDPGGASGSIGWSAPANDMAASMQAFALSALPVMVGIGTAVAARAASYSILVAAAAGFVAFVGLTIFF